MNSATGAGHPLATIRHSGQKTTLDWFWRINQDVSLSGSPSPPKPSTLHIVLVKGRMA